MSATQEELIAALRKVAEAVKARMELDDMSSTVHVALKELAELESVLPSRAQLHGDNPALTGSEMETAGAYWLRWVAINLLFTDKAPMFEQLMGLAKELEKRASE